MERRRMALHLPLFQIDDMSKQRRFRAMTRMIVSATVVLAMAAAPAFAQTKQVKAPAAAASKHSKSKPMSDHKFVTEAANGSMAEVELGKLAQDKASSEQVKSFGKRMVDDHSKALDDVK